MTDIIKSNADYNQFLIEIKERIRSAQEMSYYLILKK